MVSDLESLPEGAFVSSQSEQQHPTEAGRSSSTDASLHKVEEKNGANDYPDGGLRAWSVAAGTASIMFCTLGYTNSFGVFESYYMENQLKNESADNIAWIGSLQSFLILATGVIGGPLFDRYGAQVIWPASILYVFGIMMTSLCTEYWQFILAQGIVTGVADGLLMFPALSATPQYFRKKRGAAMGIAVAGSSIGGVVFPIMLSNMLSAGSSLSFGWSIRICGFMVIPFLAFSSVAIKPRMPPRDTAFFLTSAFRSVLFNILIVSEFCQLLGYFCLLMFIPTFAEYHGMGSMLASYQVAILNGASVFGRILPGILADRLGSLNMLFAAAASTTVLAFCWPNVEGTAGIVMFSVAFGFCSGAIMSGGSTALSLCPKDPREVGTYLGQGTAIASLAALVGPPVTGALLEKFGGFEQISIFTGVFSLVGALLILAAKAVTKEGVLGKI